jgi:tetratricopeptide (TPR) repeat protein
MREDNLLKQAITAARAGHELTARDIFLQIVESEPRNELAWLWLVGLLDELDDCIYACEMVLDINPGNANARQHLDKLLAEKQSELDAESLRAEEQVRQARELFKANDRDSALVIVHSLTQGGSASADAWCLLAELAPGMDERAHALEKLLALTPGDIQAQKELERLHHFQQNPLDLAAMYEEQGDLDKAIDTYKRAALNPGFKNQWNSIYWKIVGLENLYQEKIAYVSPAVSIARLTGGPPLLYFMLMLIQVGVNPFAHPEPLLWLGFFWVLLGGFMIALASVRSRHFLWILLFKDISAGGTPTARLAMAAAGWILVLLPYVMLFLTAFYRLRDFLISLSF